MLGPLRVRHDAGWVPVKAGQQRVVLATLLASRGRAVDTLQLIEEVWGDRPPRTAMNTVQAYVMRLRRLVGEGVLISRDHGYELVAEAQDVDAAVFESLVAAGRDALGSGQPEQAARQLSEALGLWCGPVLADVPQTPSLTAWAAQLELARLAAQEDRTAALLELGRHVEVVDELYPLVAENPLRERLCAHLMLALHRCGRRAEALEAYQRARQTLVDELGLEPGSQLREIQRLVLADEQPAPATSPSPVPAQLPADVLAFTGRDQQLKQLDSLLLSADNPAGTAVVISALAGGAGVGKTALAVHWAHRYRDRFADGQLFVNLRGFEDTKRPPVSPLEALAWFLRALGVPPARVPSNVEEASGLYRTLLTGKRVLVVLDNARDPDQIRPLLPGSPGCLALVTSREWLGGLVALSGAVSLRLEVLTDEEAHALLSRLLGWDRVQSQPQLVAELARLCGNLPLALRLAAANLSARPNIAIGEYVADLRGDRLGALQVQGGPPVGVRAAFDLSYAAMPDPIRRLFRLLSLAPGAEVTAPAAAALTGGDPAQTAKQLHRLAAAHLIDEPAPGRYALHDLLRQFAAERTAIEEQQEPRRAAVSRLYEHYLHHAVAAANLAYPQVARLRSDPAPTAGFGDAEEALVWLDSERANLVAAVREGVSNGLAGPALRLADAIRGHLHRRMHLVEWESIAQAGLAAATEDGQPQSLAAARLSLAMFGAAQGDYRQTLDQGSQALGYAQQGRWADGEAATLNVLGIAHAELGNLDHAADFFGRSLALERAADRPVNQAVRLGNLGNVELMRGSLAEAVDHYTEALALHRKLGSATGEALALDQLGLAYHSLSRLDTALGMLTEARGLLTTIGLRTYEAGTTRALAAVHRDAGRHRQALHLAETALITARDHGDRKAHADTLLTRASIRACIGHLAAALDDYRQAGEVARDIGHRYIHTQILIGQAHGHLLDRDPQAAAQAADTAVTQAREAGYRLLLGQALTMLAATQLASGEPGAALDTATQALALHLATGHRLGQAQARAIAGRAEQGTEAQSHQAVAQGLFAEIGVDPLQHTAGLLGSDR
ncbi:SARP family transcriptional regulator [Rhizocola hellebori]|uniref:SARP family transcriptional regulator n=2 Tax=Rhizocola hellebori TaxID=1392758 RepID=A0A8J3QC40_9ACTN|nr:SARP family transcriptional regulator [Rhizocola hellebori]